MPAPNTPQDLIDRIRKLERMVEDLSGRLNIRPALNTIVGGSMTIKDGGTLLVEDSDGTDVFRLGQIAPDVDGQPQQALIIRRMDGSLALTIWTSATSGPQVVTLYDKNSHGIFADDINSSGGGLANPWLPYNVAQPIARDGWGSTTSASYVAVLRTVTPLMQPKIYVQVVQGPASGGTAAGQLKVMVGGVQMVEGSVGGNIDGVFDIPSWAYAGTPQATTIEVQAKVTSGTGALQVSMRSCYGRQS